MDNVEATVIKHTEQIKTLFENDARLERVVDKIDKLAVSIEKMAVVQTDLVEEQKLLKKDVDKIKEQPAKDAHENKQKFIQAIITTSTGLIIGALITLIAMVIAKGGF